MLSKVLQNSIYNIYVCGKGRTRVDKARANVALAIVINIVIDNSMCGKLRLSMGDNLVINKCSQGGTRFTTNNKNNNALHFQGIYSSINFQGRFQREVKGVKGSNNKKTT